jgi:hypothetical protein
MADLLKTLGLHPLSRTPSKNTREISLATQDAIGALIPALSAAWQKACTDIGLQIDKLKAAVEAVAGENFELLGCSWRKVDEILVTFEPGPLIDALSTVSGNVGATQRKALATVRQAIQNERAKIEAHSLVAEIDANPFDKSLAIGATLLDALAWIDQSVTELTSSSAVAES